MINATTAEKVVCLNPNSDRKINISKQKYDLFATAIRHALSGRKKLTYTQLVEGVHRYLNDKKLSFDGSIEWYAVTVKRDMEAKGIIHCLAEKGKKLNSLSG